MGLFGREHYIPRALGTFRGLIPLADEVCRACGDELGRTVDQAIVRNSPYALFRVIAGVGLQRRGPPGPDRFPHANVLPAVALMTFASMGLAVKDLPATLQEWKKIRRQTQRDLIPAAAAHLMVRANLNIITSRPPIKERGVLVARRAIFRRAPVE